MELFSGTGSVGRVLREAGWEVVSLDVNPRWGADIQEDILTWDYTTFGPKTFDLVTASPPCVEFSRALTTRQRQLDHADKVVCKVLDIIRYFGPKWWWIENPATGILKSRPYMSELAYVNIDYCQFSDWGYQKPTRFWGIFPGGKLEDRVCNGHDCPNLVGPPSRVGGRRRHRIQLSGNESFPATWKQYRIPKDVVKYLMGMESRERVWDESPLPDWLKPLARVGMPGIVQPGDPIRACGERQLVLKVKANDGMGSTHLLDALVDTGAEANLLSKNLFPDGSWKVARRPLNLLTVAGERLEGGDKEINLDLTFGIEGDSEGTWVSHGLFHSADIHVDAILSFPWLRERGLTVCAQSGCLALETETPPMPRISNYVVPPVTEEFWFDSVKVGPGESLEFMVPVECDMGQESPLNGRERRLVQRIIASVSDHGKYVRSVVAARNPLTCPGIEENKAAILADFQDSVFKGRVSANPPKRGPLGEAVIEVIPGSEAKKQRPIQLSGVRREAFITLTKEWLKDQKIEPGVGPWSSPGFVVAKKAGKWRGVIDYRALNSATVNDSYPLPRISDILVRQGGRHLFSVIDLKDAFHQIPLEKGSRPLTGMSTPLGLMQWRVMPQGIKNGPPIFQRVLEWVLQSVSDVADPYFDDIIVGTVRRPGMSDEDLVAQHAADVRCVLEKLKEHDLVADFAKSVFFSTAVEFCGHILEDGQRRPSPGKLMSVQKFELPKTITALRGFLGLTNYYAEYVREYAHLAAPLMEKLKVDRVDGKKGSKKKIVWTEEDKVAFEKLKASLVEGLSLQHLNPDRPFVLRTDASDRAIGAVLEQLVDKERTGHITPEEAKTLKTVPVAFFSRKLTTGQVQRWTPREKEAYAVVSALEKWASWIGFQPVLVLTDHRSLEHWATEVLETPTGPSGRRARWHQLLSHFDVTVGYVPGKDNTVADVQSRYAYPASKALQDVSFHGSEKDQEEMEKIIADEIAEERQCAMVWVRPVSGGQGSGRPQFTFARPRVSAPPSPSPVSPPGEAPSPEPLGPPPASASSPPDQVSPGLESEGSDSDESASSEPPPPPLSWTGDWTWWYERCPKWGEKWKRTHTGYVWAEGIRLVDGKRMYFDGRLCVPTGTATVVLREHHNAIGHVGGDRLLAEMERWYDFGDPSEVKKIAGEIIKRCGVCQATEHPHHSMKAPLRPTPIPPRLMDSVALDVFYMEPIRYQGIEYDCMVLCVDRHSGWIVASPQQRKGLTAKKVALDMLDRAWGPFGVPSIVTSDRGPQFAGAWWRTLCAGLGIRVSHAHAYHHQANGRAEAAGRQLRVMLRKLHAEERGINWVEALPRALRNIHDRRGEAGLSPYEIVFGRLRPLEGVSYEPPREAQDALDFIQHMQDMDIKVANRLNEQHQKETAAVNRGRDPHKTFIPGQKVWYLRPRGPVTGEKMATWWLGPCPILSRTGESSYNVEVRPGVSVAAHVTQLKPYWEEVTGESIPLHFFKGGAEDLEVAPDEWVVDKIIRHRTVMGKLQFLTLWKGYDRSEATWEPVNHFIHRYSSDLVKYCGDHGIPVDLIEYLSPVPHESRSSSVRFGGVTVLGESQESVPLNETGGRRRLKSPPE